MSIGEAGFFLGVAPGLCYILWNLARARQALMAAQDTARANGEVLDLNISPSLRFNYLFRPRKFIGPNDGDGLRRAKAQLLQARTPLVRRHALGAIFVVLGAFLGVAVALGISPG